MELAGISFSWFFNPRRSLLKVVFLENFFVSELILDIGINELHLIKRLSYKGFLNIIFFFKIRSSFQKRKNRALDRNLILSLL